MKTKEKILYAIRMRLFGNLALAVCLKDEQILAAMEEYASQSKWISVEERLPEKGVRVNVYNPDFGVQIMWLDLYSSWKNSDYQHLVITHWQPLPPNPISESNK